MRNPLALLFGRDPKTVSTDTTVPKTGLLFDEIAVSTVVKQLTRLAESDETLRQAGLRRWHLRALETDDEVWQALETRSDALLATPITIKPTGKKKGEVKEDDISTVTLRAIVDGIKREAILGAWQSRKFGYSVMEAVYEVRNYLTERGEQQATGLSFIGEKPMEWFEPRPDGTLRFFARDGSSGATGEEVDTTFKFFLTRNAATYRNPFGEALLSRLYWPWWFRTQGWKFWGKFLERFGTPMLVGKSANPQDMVESLLQVHSQAVMGIGRDDEVAAVGLPSGSSGGTAFDMYESAVIRRIQKIILGQTLTSGTDGGSGNRALGQVHDGVRADKRNSDIELVRPTIQAVVNALCRVNKWPAHTITFEDDVGLNAPQATRDKDLYSTGVRFKKSYYGDNYGLRDDEFDLSSDAPVDGATPLPPAPNAKPGKGAAVAGAKASQDASLLFIRRGDTSRFTRQQQVVEDEANAAIESTAQPISQEKLRAAILGASSEDDLVTRLFALVGDGVTQDEFNAVLSNALFAADVLGYVHAEGKV